MIYSLILVVIGVFAIVFDLLLLHKIKERKKERSKDNYVDYINHPEYITHPCCKCGDIFVDVKDDER